MKFTSTTQNIGWFADRYMDGSLSIKPPFQRKPVWTMKQKCPLVESILLSLPVPEVYVQSTVTAQGQSIYAVVDGQQRIRTVLQFIGSDRDPEEQQYNKFALEQLEPGSEWKDATFADLSDQKKKDFYGYRFAVRFLETEVEQEVRDMFRRLNKFLTPLNAQELRHATYSGPFVRLAEQLANRDYWTENGLVSPAMIRRMTDIEFVSELLIGIIHGPQGGSAKIVDEYYKLYEEYDIEFPEQRRVHKWFEQTLELIGRLVPDLKLRRWGNRTDFYSLFVALAQMVRTGTSFDAGINQLKQALTDFALEVDTRLADEKAGVTEDAIEYVRAVEKGANEKKRRGDRHVVLTRLVVSSLEAGKKA